MKAREALEPGAMETPKKRRVEVVERYQLLGILEFHGKEEIGTGLQGSSTLEFHRKRERIKTNN